MREFDLPDLQTKPPGPPAGHPTTWDEDMDKEEAEVRTTIERWNTSISEKDELVADPETGALKADGNKLRFDLMPSRPLEDVVRILTFGAEKYHDRNWEAGMQWGRPFAACMRHLWAWWRGEDKDPDSGLSHLAHAACNLIFLMEFEYTHPEMDNRPKENNNGS